VAAAQWRRRSEENRKRGVKSLAKINLSGREAQSKKSEASYATINNNM